MDGKLLARFAAAAFVGIAFAMTLVQLREEPAPKSVARPVAKAKTNDPLPRRLRACSRSGEAALSDPDCLAAWAENRSRFFDVDHPHAYAGIAGEADAVAGEPRGSVGPERD